MKHYHTLLNSTYALALGALLSVNLSGCAATELVDEPGNVPSELGDVTVIATLGQGVDTRTGLEEADPGNPTKGIKVSWAAGDDIKIISLKEDNTQSITTFTFAGMTADNASGIFKGKAEPESNTGVYSVIYPARVTIHEDEGYLFLDMTGQTQWGNGNMAHLGAYDMMYVETNDWRSFSFADTDVADSPVTCHTNALMTFDLKGIPADLGRPQSITLGCTYDKPVFYSNIQNMDNTYLVPTLELKLTGFETPAEGTTVDIKAYLMMATCAIPGRESLTITVKGDKGSYMFTSASVGDKAKQYKAGKRYTATVDAGWTKVFSGVDYTGVEPIEELTGSGTSAADPYVIATPGQLRKLVGMNKTNTSDKYFRLDSDIRINMAGGQLWTPIGSSDRFAGTFDGNGHTISGVMGDKTTPRSSVGFFTNLDGATIKNLTVDATIYGNYYVGGIVAQDKSDAAPCYINNCTNKSKITAKGQYVGGIMGSSNNTYIMGCVNEGQVMTDDPTNSQLMAFGGIVGELKNGAVVGCYNTGKIILAKNSIAGVVGYFSSGTIAACYHTGRFMESSGYNAIAGMGPSLPNRVISYCQYMGDLKPFPGGNSTADVATLRADVNELNTDGVVNLNTGITAWNNAHPTQPCSFKFVAGTDGAEPRLVPAVIPN